MNGTFIHVYPMASKLEAGDALSKFVQDVGIPEVVIVDGAQEQVGKNTEFNRTCKYYKIQQRQTEPYTPRQNRAESAIGEVKKRWRNKMRSKGVPKRLWDYGLVWVSEITNRTARGPEARTPLEALTGNTPDISEWLDFDFYDWCWYWQGPTHELTEDKAEIGRVLGVAHRVGSDLCYWVLTSTGKVIARMTVQQVVTNDYQLPTVKTKMEEFYAKVKDKFKDERHREPAPADGLILDDEDANDEPEEGVKVEQDDFTDDSYNAYLGAELLVPSGDNFIVSRVIKRVRDEDGNPVGQRNNNPILDTRRYEVQFGDGSMIEYTANLVAENLLAQSNPEGRRHMIFKEIVDHRSGDSAIKKEEGFTVSFNGNVHPKKTTRGGIFASSGEMVQLPGYPSRMSRMPTLWS